MPPPSVLYRFNVPNDPSVADLRALRSDFPEELRERYFALKVWQALQSQEETAAILYWRSLEEYGRVAPASIPTDLERFTFPKEFKKIETIEDLMNDPRVARIAFGHAGLVCEGSLRRGWNFGGTGTESFILSQTSNVIEALNEGHVSFRYRRPIDVQLVTHYQSALATHRSLTGRIYPSVAQIIGVEYEEGHDYPESSPNVVVYTEPLNPISFNLLLYLAKTQEKQYITHEMIEHFTAAQEIAIAAYRD